GDGGGVAPGTGACVGVPTGRTRRRAHWQALLRARAIENQAYVVGCNRVGTGGSLEYSGDSAIVDPMGETLAAAAGGEALIVADVTAERVAEVRAALPFLPDRAATPSPAGPERPPGRRPAPPGPRSGWMRARSPDPRWHGHGGPGRRRPTPAHGRHARCRPEPARRRPPELAGRPPGAALRPPLP